jgi:hypothetical protein
MSDDWGSGCETSALFPMACISLNGRGEDEIDPFPSFQLFSVLSTTIGKTVRREEKLEYHRFEGGRSESSDSKIWGRLRENYAYIRWPIGARVLLSEVCCTSRFAGSKIYLLISRHVTRMSNIQKAFPFSLITSNHLVYCSQVKGSNKLVLDAFPLFKPGRRRCFHSIRNFNMSTHWLEELVQSSVVKLLFDCFSIPGVLIIDNLASEYEPFDTVGKRILHRL